MKYRLAILIIIFLQACVSGPELNSKWSYLNGDSYKSKKNILGVPVLKTKCQEKIKTQK